MINAKSQNSLCKLKVETVVQISNLMLLAGCISLVSTTILQRFAIYNSFSGPLAVEDNFWNS